MLETRSGRIVALTARALIGRSPGCHVRVEDPRASGEHAAIAWSGARWEVRDLGSLNGTWVDGRRVGAGERAALAQGAQLGFGASTEPWILADARAPGAAARDEASGATVHAAGGLLALPSVDDPSATVLRRADGAWVVELGAEVRVVADGERLDAGGARWLLFLPAEAGPATGTGGRAPRRLAEVGLALAPSPDEEHVEVRILDADGGASLLPPRASYHVLLVLARTRVRDAREGVAAEEQGWIYASDLADLLQCTTERLSIEVFRARSVFGRLGFTDAAQLIERRPGTGQVRIGVARLTVAAP